ncbi:hypothetical protein [Salmonella enterica]|uniref:hypothetical protein n=1 Tax=Salmonella enterica TaxID=28901 RepID=UPI0009B045A9|nr:hypothetical protein [Salmonella enterica]ELX5323348.1 hypothetical protein [Salmonella enterica]
MIKIRRNAFKKISSILSTAKGVISCTSWAQVDDSHETQYSVSTPEEALEWLQENQAKACVYLDGNELVICGPYYFSDSFTAYIDEAEFLAAVASLIKEDAPEGEEVIAPVVAEEVPLLVAANEDNYEPCAANDDFFEVEYGSQPYI